MKFGVRTPSLKKSIKARTMGKAKRAVKKHSYLDMEKREWDGLKIPRKQHIIKYITRQVLVCLIYSSSTFLIILVANTKFYTSGNAGILDVI